MKQNKILTEFLDMIDEAHKIEASNIDVKKILTPTQFRQFTQMEQVINDMFTSNNLHEGIRKTIDGAKLTNTQQINVLIMLKIFETFIGAMKEAGIQPDSGSNYDLPPTSVVCMLKTHIIGKLVNVLTYSVW